MWQIRYRGGIAPHILKVNTWWMWVFSYTPRPLYPPVHCTVVWVGPRAGLHVLKKKQISFTLLKTKPWSLGRRGLRVATVPAALRSVTDLVKEPFWSAHLHCSAVASCPVTILNLVSWGCDDRQLMPLRISCSCYSTWPLELEPQTTGTA